MKVLFVSSANRNGEPNPVVMNQGMSLIREGIEVRFYGIRGRGLSGYFRNIKSLRNEIRKFKPDIVHAHYLLSGMVAGFAGFRPLVVSLMGSDVLGGRWQRLMSSFLSGHVWDTCIVKTNEMKRVLRNGRAQVIPNGVNMDHFAPEPVKKALKETGWDGSKINILFPSDPERPEKNYGLAEECVKLMEDDRACLHVLKDVPRDRVVHYLNAADIVLLTSRWEGSPNIIKEAMACNIPVVSTKVGDVEEIFNGIDGCYLFEGDPYEGGRALNLAAEKKPTGGREHVRRYDTGTVSRKIIKVYADLLSS
jgi:teichuronic acid biosynthesis glycosyltransferase TuaC